LSLRSRFGQPLAHLLHQGVVRPDLPLPILGVAGAERPDRTVLVVAAKTPHTLAGPGGSSLMIQDPPGWTGDTVRRHRIMKMFGRMGIVLGGLALTQDEQGLKVILPAQGALKYACTLKISGLTMNPPGDPVPAVEADVVH
jgi:hypothetical protein